MGRGGKEGRDSKMMTLGPRNGTYLLHVIAQHVDKVCIPNSLCT